MLDVKRSTVEAIADLVRIGWTYEDVSERWPWLPLHELIEGTCMGIDLAASDFLVDFTDKQIEAAMSAYCLSRLVEVI